MKGNQMNSEKNKSVKSVKRGVGRPRYVPVFPTTKRWTFSDFCTTNGVDLKTKKGPQCSALTLVKFLDNDRFMSDKEGNIDKTRPKCNSTVVILKGEFVKPNSENGKGRPAFVFALRSKNVLPKKTALKTAKASKVSVPLADVPVPVENAPVTSDSPAIVETVAAIAPEVTPVPEVAPVTETAPVAAEVAPEPVLA